MRDPAPGRPDTPQQGGGGLGEAPIASPWAPRAAFAAAGRRQHRQLDLPRLEEAACCAPNGKTMRKGSAQIKQAAAMCLCRLEHDAAIPPDDDCRSGPMSLLRRRDWETPAASSAITAGSVAATPGGASAISPPKQSKQAGHARAFATPSPTRASPLGSFAWAGASKRRARRCEPA